VLWTAAHHNIPLLAVMHNNRAYHQEVMEIQQMAARHQRETQKVIWRRRASRPSTELRSCHSGVALLPEFGDTSFMPAPPMSLR